MQSDLLPGYMEPKAVAIVTMKREVNTREVVPSFFLKGSASWELARELGVDSDSNRNLRATFTR